MERRDIDSHGPKITRLEPTHLSNALPDAALYLACFFIIFALCSVVLQRGLLQRLYGSKYAKINDKQIGEKTTEHEYEASERQRISFTYHNIAAAAFLVIMIIGVYPVLNFLAGKGTLTTPLRSGGKVTVGDMLFVVSQLYSGYYLFELGFRSRFISYIAIAHHVGLLMITQMAIVLEARLAHNKEATMEFYLCMMWGFFDICTELPIHILLIIWRLNRSNTRLCYYISLAIVPWVVTMALLETAFTIYLLNQTWAKWKTVWHIVTPIIFTLWVCTQFYGASIFWGMAQKERKKLRTMNSHEA